MGYGRCLTWKSKNIKPSSSSTGASHLMKMHRRHQDSRCSCRPQACKYHEGSSSRRDSNSDRVAPSAPVILKRGRSRSLQELGLRVPALGNSRADEIDGLYAVVVVEAPLCCVCAEVEAVLLRVVIKGLLGGREGGGIEEAPALLLVKLVDFPFPSWKRHRQTRRLSRGRVTCRECAAAGRAACVLVWQQRVGTICRAEGDGCIPSI